MPDDPKVIRLDQIGENDVLAQAGDGGWVAFRAPREVIRADRPSDVAAALATADQALARGTWVAGLVGYEAAPGQGTALTARPPGPEPLIWLGVYDPPEPVRLDLVPDPPPPLDWTPALSAAAFADRVRRIKGWIASGDTYQVNLTFPLQAALADTPWPTVAGLFRAQPPRVGAIVHAGRHLIASASPELFLERDLGGRVISRPMKGTRPRPSSDADTEASARELAAAAKDRAENIMIVDMIRNDLGRVAIPGTVSTGPLFEVEPYPTVLQMTSTVSARTDVGLGDLFRATFPCASITGAPKRRTMEIIQELEASPRGTYTGAMGWAAPDGRLRFNVAIRTLRFDLDAGLATYGVGAGIVWDSDPEREYTECLDKAEAAVRGWPAFQLLETLAWRPESGFVLLDAHLRRLGRAAGFFQFDCDEATVRAALADAVRGAKSPQLVRLLVDRLGCPQVEAFPLAENSRPWVVALDTRPTDTRSPFVTHKTTHRTLYEDALRRHPGCDDVIRCNRDGRITESTRANVVVFGADGPGRTPPEADGLLPGVLREAWLAEGRITEAPLTPDDLLAAREVLLLNSVRGPIHVRWASSP